MKKIVLVMFAMLSMTTAFAENETEFFKQPFDFAETVHTKTEVAFLSVRNTEYRRHSAFRLHYVAHKRNSAVPVAGKIAERFLDVRPSVKFKGNFGKYAVRAFTAHHNLIDIGSRCLSRRAFRPERPRRRNVLLR